MTETRKTFMAETLGNIEHGAGYLVLNEVYLKKPMSVCLSAEDGTMNGGLDASPRRRIPCMRQPPEFSSSVPRSQTGTKLSLYIYKFIYPSIHKFMHESIYLSIHPTNFIGTCGMLEFTI